MPIYLVRWPGKSVSIVRAKDKIELMDILDEVDDCGRCRIKEYRGPLYIPLDLDINYHIDDGDEEYIFDDVSHCLENSWFEIGGAISEKADEMKDEICKFAFPSYYEYLEEFRDKLVDQPLMSGDETLCKRALQQDFVEPLEPSLKKRIDQDLKWAEAMGILNTSHESTDSDTEDE